MSGYSEYRYNAAKAAGVSFDIKESDQIIMMMGDIQLAPTNRIPNTLTVISPVRVFGETISRYRPGLISVEKYADTVELLDYSYSDEFTINTPLPPNVISLNRTFEMTNAKTIPGIEKWDLSKIKNVVAMFRHAKKFNQDISMWDVHNVRTMALMFSGAERFNQPLGDWGVSNVRNMFGMFSCAERFNQPLGDWDVHNVRNFENMFSGAKSFSQNIDNWELTNMKSASNMFLNADKFEVAKHPRIVTKILTQLANQY